MDGVELKMRRTEDPRARLLRNCHVEPMTGCWLWLGHLLRSGYGQFYLRGRKTTAHRASYELFVGPVPAGMEIDHVRARGCATRACANPAHLEPVTHLENVRRGEKATAPVCKRGHAFSMLKSGSRFCRECQRASQRANPRSKQRCREYHAGHKQEILERKRQWREANRDVINAKKREARARAL